jgi:hypothetical protein
MSPDDAQVRQDICAGCAARCAAPAPLDPCFACPRHIYQAHAGCGAEGHASDATGLRGMGDVVAVVAQPIARVVGLENCGGCKKRQADWNREMPFGGEPEAGTVV